jgi:hypothetical protein
MHMMRHAGQWVGRQKALDILTTAAGCACVRLAYKPAFCKLLRVQSQWTYANDVPVCACTNASVCLGNLG